MQPILNTIAAPNATIAPAPSPRLVSAAHEFEAQMMKELIQPLNRGGSLGVPGSDSGSDADTDSDDDSGSTGALGQFASEALGRALSERGGLGIATSILKQLSPKGNGHRNASDAASVIPFPHANTVIKSAQ